MVVILTGDLMIASTANSFGQQHQVAVSQTSKAEKALEIIDESRPHVLLVDLQTSNLDVGQLGEKISSLADSVAPLTIAYAQHVYVDLLEEAKSAGFDQVLTRGQLNSQLGRIIEDAK